MAVFIMLTRLAHGALRSPEQLEKLEKDVVGRVEKELGKGVTWRANYACSDPTTISTSSRPPTSRRRFMQSP